MVDRVGPAEIVPIGRAGFSHRTEEPAAAGRSPALSATAAERKHASAPACEAQALHGAARQGHGFLRCADVRGRLGGRGGHTADVQEGQLPRKTNMGVWSCECTLMTAMRLRFQARVGR